MRGKTGFSSSFIPSKNNIVHGAIFLERTIINTWIQDDEMALILYTAVEKEKPKLLLSTQLVSHQANKLKLNVHPSNYPTMAKTWSQEKMSLLF